MLIIKALSAHFLKKHPLFVSILILVCVVGGAAESVDAEERSPLFDLSGSAPAITPDIERRDLTIPNIDTESFEIGVFYGVLSVENLGANSIKGINASFFMTEDFFITVNAGFSRVDDGVYRRLNLPIFGETGTRNLIEKSVLLGWNVLPGEFFLADKQAFSADLYIVGGMGSVIFDKESHASYVAGLGLRILPRDWFSIRFESKISEYKTSILGYEKFNHNVDVVTGISVFF